MGSVTGETWNAGTVKGGSKHDSSWAIEIFLLNEEDVLYLLNGFLFHEPKLQVAILN